MRGETKVIKLFDGAVATGTSAIIDIKGAERVTLICNRASHTAGTTTFTGEVGAGTAYASYNKWISNVTNTNAQDLTRVANLVLNSNSTGFLTMSPEDAFEFIKITATRATDGAHTAWLVVDYK
jgi:hypothetical protein